MTDYDPTDFGPDVPPEPIGWNANENQRGEPQPPNPPTMPDEVAAAILALNMSPWHYKEHIIHAGDVVASDVVRLNGVWHFVTGELKLEPTDNMNLVMIMTAGNPIGFAVQSEVRLAAFVHYEMLMQH